MSKMKLYNVTVNYTIPVGAEDAIDAQDLVIDLLRCGEEYVDSEIGFGEAEFEVSEIKSMVLVPEFWKDVPLFNTEDLDNVTAKTILEEHIDDIAQTTAKRQLYDTMKSLQGKVSKEDLIKWVSENTWY